MKKIQNLLSFPKVFPRHTFLLSAGEARRRIRIRKGSVFIIISIGSSLASSDCESASSCLSATKRKVWIKQPVLRHFILACHSNRWNQLVLDQKGLITVTGYQQTVLITKQVKTDPSWFPAWIPVKMTASQIHQPTCCSIDAENLSKWHLASTTQLPSWFKHEHDPALRPLPTDTSCSAQPTGVVLLCYCYCYCNHSLEAVR